MIMSLVFVFVALAQISGASRIHPLASALGLQATHRFSPRGAARLGAVSRGTAVAPPHGVARTAMRKPRVQRTAVRAAARSIKQNGDDDVPEVWKPDTIAANWRADLGSKEPTRSDWRLTWPGSGQARADWGAKTLLWNFSQTGMFPFPQEPFPPLGMYGIDTMKLLDAWVQSMWAVRIELLRVMEVPGILTEPTSLLGLLAVLEKMKDDISYNASSFVRLDNSTLVKSRQLEAVGLMPKTDSGRATLEWPSDSDSVEASVMALAVFSRVEFHDNSFGHALSGYALEKEKNKMGQYPDIPMGQMAMRLRKSLNDNISVFAIEGLAEAPDLSARPARVLLTKIAKWAEAEQSLVMVARDAIHVSDGVTQVDLTPYYMKLGFEKVELKDGSYDLVYTGYPWDKKSTDQFLGDRQFMVRVNAFYGSSPR